MLAHEEKTLACLACPGDKVVLTLCVSIYNLVFITQYCCLEHQNAPSRLLMGIKIPGIVFRFRENESCNENENASNLLSFTKPSFIFHAYHGPSVCYRYSNRDYFTSSNVRNIFRQCGFFGLSGA